MNSKYSLFSFSSKSFPNTAFTLVELVVVITILSILGTVGFVSIQSYSLAGRDSTRITDMGILERAFTFSRLQTGTYPLPDSATTILGSGTLLSNQGYVGSGVIGFLRTSDIKDPLDRTSQYIYSTNNSRTKFELMGFFEDKTKAPIGMLLEDTAHAADYSNRFPGRKGDNLGILLGSNNVPPTDSSIDILTTNSGTLYTAYFLGDESVTQSGTELFGRIYNRRPELLRDVNLAKLDPHLVGYWDMETTTLSSGRTVLKDLSYYGNNGDCYDGSFIKDCGTPGFGPQFSENDGKSGKAMDFDGVNDWIKIQNDPRITYSGSITVIAKMKLEKLCTVFIDGDPCLDTIFMKGGSSTPGVWMIAGYMTKFLTEVNGNSGGYYLVSNTKNTTENTVLVFTKDNNVNKYFINGVLDTVVTSNYNLLNNSEVLTIGSAFNTYNRVFDGLIDELRIYNRTLSDTEIGAVYESIQ